MSANILALDTATEACSVALQWLGKRYCLSKELPRKHSQEILNMIQTVLEQSQSQLSELQAIAFGRGPGSFTGVRVAVAAAQGLAFGASLPVISVSTIQTIAQQAVREFDAKNVVVATDAGMSKIYHGIYRSKDSLAELVGNEQVCLTSSLVVDKQQQGFSAGTGWVNYQERLAKVYPEVKMPPRVLLANAFDMIDIAENLFNNGQIILPEHAAPTYLYDKTLWKKLPRKA